MAISRVLITGAQGQVGSELLQAKWPDHYEVRGVSRSELDITDRTAVAREVASFSPDLIVNAAAYTAVDAAEENQEQAFAVNRDAVRSLCATASEVEARVLHLSTDYVFDGKATGWYAESDEPSPLGVYGQSKHEGELFALSYPTNVVVRTSWVYSANNSNFVRTMRRLALTQPALRVVADQFGCPTSAQDLARALVAAISQDLRWSGLFHLAAPDDATWFDVATAAIEQMELPAEVNLEPITTAEYPTPAPRPANSRLSSAKFYEGYGIALLPWRKALEAVSQELACELTPSGPT